MQKQIFYFSDFVWFVGRCFGGVCSFIGAGEQEAALRPGWDWSVFPALRWLWLVRLHLLYVICLSVGLQTHTHYKSADEILAWGHIFMLLLYLIRRLLDEFITTIKYTIIIQLIPHCFENGSIYTTQWLPIHWKVHQTTDYKQNSII